MNNKFTVADLDIPWNRVGGMVYTGDAKCITTDGDVPCNVLKILVGTSEESSNESKD